MKSEISSAEVIVDANVVLRFLRRDHAQFSEQARELFEKAQRKEVTLTFDVITLAEIFYAFRASYRLSRKSTAEILLQFVRTGICQIDRFEEVLESLEWVRDKNVDFGDAWLAVLWRSSSETRLATFDKEFDRLCPDRLWRWEL